MPFPYCSRRDYCPYLDHYDISVRRKERDEMLKRDFMWGRAIFTTTCCEKLWLTIHPRKNISHKFSRFVVHTSEWMDGNCRLHSKASLVVYNSEFVQKTKWGKSHTGSLKLYSTWSGSSFRTLEISLHKRIHCFCGIGIKIAADNKLICEVFFKFQPASPSIFKKGVRYCK